MTRPYHKSAVKLHGLDTAYLAWSAGVKKPSEVAYPPEGLYDMPRKGVADSEGTGITCKMQVMGE